MMAIENKAGAAAPSPEPVAAAGFVRLWRTSAGLAAAGVLAIVALYRDTAALTVETWMGSTAYNHAFLILPIVGYLLWDRRHQVAGLAPRATAWGLAAVAVAASAWLLGAVAGVRVVQQFALVTTLLGLVLGVFGWRISWALAFPLGYLFLAVPFGDFLIAPLQDLTARFAVSGLQFLGIPVYLEGVFIYIPSGTFEVAEACAGLRFLIASIALGVLFADLTYRSWSRRIAFLSLTLIVPVIANGFRALGIILLAYYSDNKIAMGVDHIVYGWIFFAIVTMILLSIGMTFRDRGLDERPPPRPAGAAGGRLAASFVVTVAILSLVAGSSVYAEYSGRRGAAGGEIRLTPPAAAPPWEIATGRNDDWRPKYRGADAELRQTYVAGDGRRVVLFVAFYARQREGAEVVNSSNSVAGDDVWVRAAGGLTTARLDGDAYSVAYTRIMSRSGRRVVWHWYWVDGQLTADPYKAKLLQIKARLLGGNPSAAVVAVAADYEETPEQAADLLRDFVGRMPSWRKALKGMIRP